jgi:hypothetical protein
VNALDVPLGTRFDMAAQLRRATGPQGPDGLVEIDGQPMGGTIRGVEAAQDLL